MECHLISYLCLQSDLLVVKKKNKRYCPIYFTKVGLRTWFLLSVFLEKIIVGAYLYVINMSLTV